MVLIITLPKTNRSNSPTFDVSIPPSIPISIEPSARASDELLQSEFEAPAAPTVKTYENRVQKKIRPKANRQGDLNNDGQSRRELLLKGKAGSRRRKRYENANFLNVPNSQPPQPSDWEVHPTYPVYQNVPYYLAPLWDSKFQRLSEERTAYKSSLPAPHGRVSQDLRLTLKRARGAKSLLQYLETEVRNFIQETICDRCSEESVDTEDEEIVFIGRDKDGRVITMSHEKEQFSKQKRTNERLVFETRPQGGGGFTRWLVHELAEYYGLKSYSQNTDTNSGEAEKSVRNIIVSFQNDYDMKLPRFVANPPSDEGVYQMPRPLWGLI